MSESRLIGLSRLRHVPRDAVRGLLLAHGVAEQTLRNLSVDALLQLCENRAGIRQEHVDQLYEDHRYGFSPHLHIRLLPGSLNPPDPAIWDPCLDDVAPNPALRDLVLADLDSFDDFTELRFRYQRAYDYLDEDEWSNRLWETRFGFVWVNAAEAFLAVMARDAVVVNPVVAAVARVLKVTAVQPRLSKEIVDRFALPGRAARRRFVASDGVTRSYSGLPTGDARSLVDAELRGRLDAGDEPRGGQYAEQVEYQSLRLGVDHATAALTLSRRLPLTVLRRWLRERLVPILRVVQESEPEQLRVDASAFDVSSFPTSQRAAVRAFAKALVIARYAPHPTAVPIEVPLRRLLQPVRANFNIQEVAWCQACKVEDRSVCGSCGEYDLLPPSQDDDAWICARCKAGSGRECSAGHLFSPARDSTVMARPYAPFCRRIMAVAAVQPPFDDNDSFVIWNAAVRLAKRGTAIGISLTFEEGSKNAVNVDSAGGIAIVEKEGAEY